MQYRLNVVRVFVADWERAVQFYEKTLGMPLAYRGDDVGWAQFGTGECLLAIERVDPTDEEGRALVGRYVGASLAVPDIHAAYTTLTERGVEFLAPPEQQPWGGVLADLRDPDGNIITLLGNPG